MTDGAQPIAGQVVPTLERALADARKLDARVVGLKLDAVKVAYIEHPEFGTEEFEFEGASIAQLVPFAELAMRDQGLPVPTITCPHCLGGDLSCCPTCRGLGKVLPSQVTSQEAAASPTLDKYRE
jgi:hypothetical protein